MFDLENDTSFEWLTAGRLAKDRGKAPERPRKANLLMPCHPTGVPPPSRPP